MALPLVMSYPYRSQMDYAAILQDEGSFGEITREAWATAYREWTEEYGRTEFATPGGMVVFEATEGQIARMAEEDGTPVEQKAYWQGRYQDMVNYRFWKLRCNAERSVDMAGARHDFALGRKLFREEQKLMADDMGPGAKETLYSGLEKMQRVVDEYRLPDGTSQLLNDETELVEDSIKSILIWQHVLSLLGEPVPEEFPLDEVWTDPRFEELRVGLFQEFLRWQGGSLAP
jgi:hypothetical protein